MRLFRIPVQVLTLKTKLTLMLSLTLALLLSSCGILPPHVVVVDTAGRPVAGAQMAPISAFINYKPVLSDSKGRVRFAPSYLKREWFDVAKDGYAPHAFVNLTDPKPVRVVLTKEMRASQPIP